MSLYNIHIDPANVDTDGLADGLTGAGPWDSTDFALTATPDGLAHQLNLTSAADLSAITITIDGTDADDNTITEDVTGPNATTVETTKYFKTISAVTASATLGASTLDIGWVDEIASPTYRLNYREPVPAGIFQLDVTGTIDLDVQFFTADPGSFTEQSLIPHNTDTDLDGETADVFAYIEEMGYTGFRVIVNSYTDTAEFKLYTSQP